MCASCHKRGKILGKIPERCPACGAKFNPHPSQGEEETVTDILYNLIVRHKPDKGFIVTDTMGWSTGGHIQFPYEVER